MTYVDYVKDYDPAEYVCFGFVNDGYVMVLRHPWLPNVGSLSLDLPWFRRSFTVPAWTSERRIKGER